jgi:hypothetical protein
VAVVGDVNDGDDGGDSVVVILWWLPLTSLTS